MRYHFSIVSVSFFFCCLMANGCWAKPKLHYGRCRGETEAATKFGFCVEPKACAASNTYINENDAQNECQSQILTNLICCLNEPVDQSSDYCRETLQIRIARGTPTGIGEYPWMAQLLYTNDGQQFKNKCAGALIAKRWILTAGHCVPPPNTEDTESKLLRVRLGEWDARQADTTMREDYSIERIIVHEEYKPTEGQISVQKHSNDIALLQLARSVTFTDFIRPICLPDSRPADGNNRYANAQLEIAGWGRTDDSSPESSPIKMKATVRGWSQADCSQRYGDVTAGQMCAGGRSNTSSTSCQGDSGGPVMLNDHVIGIISLGQYKCGSVKGPMVFTRVDHYVAWLEEQMKKFS